MNTTLKRIILIFTFLCMILLIVFCVELILLNRKEEEPEPQPPEPPPAELLPVEPETPPEQPPEEPATPTGMTEPSSGGPETEIAGTRYELELVSDVELILYVDDELFEFEDMEQTWMFNHVDGSTKFEVSPVYLPQGAAVYANTFLGEYLEGEPYSVRGTRPIGGSQIEGIYATGSSGEKTVSAWVSAIETVDGDNMGMVVVMTYSDVEGRDAILSALDTMDMITAEEDAEGTDAGGEEEPPEPE